MSGELSARTQRRVTVTPVLVGYVRAFMGKGGEKLAKAIETGIVVDTIAEPTVLADAFWSLVTFAQDLTAELVDRDYTPYPRTGEEYTIERIRVSWDTHAMADSLRDTVVQLSRFRMFVERGL